MPYSVHVLALEVSVHVLALEVSVLFTNTLGSTYVSKTYPSSSFVVAAMSGSIRRCRISETLMRVWGAVFANPLRFTRHEKI